MTAANPISRPTLAPGVEALAAVAHELRLPLSHIKVCVSALRRIDVEWDSETRKRFLANIEVEAVRLAELIEALIEAGWPGAKPQDAAMVLAPPAAVIDGAVDRARGALADRPVRRHVASDLPLVRVNVGQIERVLANLLQNAIKYTPAGSPIDVSARITRNDELELVVEDRGPGVPAAEREEIFQPFFRGHHATGSSVPGNGLGLAICPSIVLAHGGRMAVTNRAGGGAAFSVFLPLPLDRSKERGNDPANHSRRRRRGPDAETVVS